MSLAKAAINIEHVERSIPRLLRERRKALGFTLQKLAEASQLSVSLLSQMERGKIKPSLMSMLSISAALEVDINYFVTSPTVGDVIRRASTPIRIDMDSSIEYYRLDGDFSGKKMGALQLVIPPKCIIPKGHREEGEDFVYVLEGVVRIEFENEKYELGAGDSIHFNSQVDHMGENIGDEEARIIWVGTPTIFKD